MRYVQTVEYTAILPDVLFSYTLFIQSVRLINMTSIMQMDVLFSVSIILINNLCRIVLFYPARTHVVMNQTSTPHASLHYNVHNYESRKYGGVQKTRLLVYLRNSVLISNFIVVIYRMLRLISVTGATKWFQQIRDEVLP